ncbi:DUF5522 domain-containing protein [Lacihabitans sp. CCS-44]|uniref:DUF5522 domain-containing protein n=1 Tax=Lacihabitans sp. CCS-44 TaxID=2487331 RepID=UPI0020CF41E1|nr:DUF5522 domain-containing protein [Lacihabitans sp. CCS-44]
MKILKKKISKNADYYFNKEGLVVFTKEYHLRRGYCCKSNCLNCPYKLEINV